MPASELVAIPDGASIFIDANIFIYHFSGPTVLTPACSDFLKRVEGGAIRGFTSTIVLIEVLHRLMILEAVGTFQLPARDALRCVKEHPHQAKTLVVHQASVQKIRQIGVEVVTVGVEDIERSHQIKRTHGLLTNDALLGRQPRWAARAAHVGLEPSITPASALTVARAAQPSPC